MANGYRPFHGGGFSPRLTPLGLEEYQRMITQGDPNSPLFNAPRFSPRQGGDLRGVQSFGTIEQPEQQNVGTVASQIDANLSALEGAEEARQLYNDTTFGFNAQQGEWPGTVFQDTGNFISDVGTGAENIYTAGENFITGADKPMGLLSGDLMKDMAVQDALDTSGNLLPGGIDPEKGVPSSDLFAGKGNWSPVQNNPYLPTSNASTYSTAGGSPAITGGRFGGVSGSSAGNYIGQNASMIPSADVSQARQLFGPQGIDPMNWDSYDAATGQFPATPSVRPAAQASAPMASAAQNLGNVQASASQAAPITNWSELGGNIFDPSQLDTLGQTSLMADTATKGAELGGELAAGSEAAAGSGWGSKVLPGIGAGLSIYDMIEGGVNPGNVMGLGSALSFLAPASMSLGPLGWALAGGSLLGSLFDWW